MDAAITTASVLFFFAGGTMMAMNMQYSATESATSTRAGRMFPAMAPSRVPMVQPGIATAICP